MILSGTFYEKSYTHHLRKLRELVPEQMQAWQTFTKVVMEDGALTRKEKEIIAVAIAHVTACPYCIDFHTKQAKKQGATLPELAEAVFVAMAIEAGGAVTHSTHVHNTGRKDASDALYTRSNLKFLQKIGEYAPDEWQAYNNFSSTATKEGALSAKLKELIAVAVAHVTQCPYCIEAHANKAQKLGATNDELAEAIMVAAELRAGKAYSHLANMIASFSEE